MSEYMERHTVSRLIGAPPGYVGFDQGGLLTDGVDQHPHCVLLLDEVEKAHPDLFNILLQVMDHGKLTDHNGKQIDFRNVILIMTTNAGAADMAKSPIGFNRAKREGDDMEAINKLFTPEFRNRLDAIIPFGSLPAEVIYQVVTKFVLELEAQLADRNVTFELSDAAIKWLAEEGYDERMGARPLSRVIQEHIKRPLADEVLFGKLMKGGTVKVDVEEKDGKKQLSLETIADEVVRPKRPAKPKKAPAPKKARRSSGSSGSGGSGGSSGSGGSGGSGPASGAPTKRPSKGSLVPKVPLTQ
jgi:ATP-dependent Clp protease ATP-binding subunit ClpA